MQTGFEEKKGRGGEQSDIGPDLRLSEVVFLLLSSSWWKRGCTVVVELLMEGEG